MNAAAGVAQELYGLSSGVVTAVETYRLHNAAGYSRGVSLNPSLLGSPTVGGGRFAPFLSESFIGGARLLSKVSGVATVGFSLYEIYDSDNLSDRIFAAGNVGIAGSGLVWANNPYVAAATSGYFVGVGIGTAINWATDVHQAWGALNEGLALRREAFGTINERRAQFAEHCE